MMAGAKNSERSLAIALQHAISATIFLEDHLMERVGEIDFDITVSPFVDGHGNPEILVTSDSDVSRHLPAEIIGRDGVVAISYKNNYSRLVA